MKPSPIGAPRHPGKRSTIAPEVIRSTSSSQAPTPHPLPGPTTPRPSSRQTIARREAALRQTVVAGA